MVAVRDDKAASTRERDDTERIRPKLKEIVNGVGSEWIAKDSRSCRKVFRDVLDNEQRRRTIGNASSRSNER